MDLEGKSFSDIASQIGSVLRTSPERQIMDFAVSEANRIESEKRDAMYNDLITEYTQGNNPTQEAPSSYELRDTVTKIN